MELTGRVHGFMESVQVWDGSDLKEVTARPDRNIAPKP